MLAEEAERTEQTRSGTMLDTDGPGRCKAGGISLAAQPDWVNRGAPSGASECFWQRLKTRELFESKHQQRLIYRLEDRRSVGEHGAAGMASRRSRRHWWRPDRRRDPARAHPLCYRRGSWRRCKIIDGGPFARVDLCAVCGVAWVFWFMPDLLSASSSWALLAGNAS